MKITFGYPFFRGMLMGVLLLFLGNYGRAQHKNLESGRTEEQLVGKSGYKVENRKKIMAEKWEMDLNNKGIGPIKVLELSEVVNPEMANAGKRIFEDSCISCHRINEQFAAPPVGNVLLRRSPEWVMNLLLNPMEMVERDTIAKNLRIRYGMPMPDMGLTEKEARELVEYFRSLLKE